MQALARGYESVRREPAGGGREPVNAEPGPRPEAPAGQRARPRCPYYFPSNPALPWGWQDPTQWNAYGEWMLKNHLISDPNAVLDASTNELLAGQGI